MWDTEIPSVACSLLMPWEAARKWSILLQDPRDFPETSIIILLLGPVQGGGAAILFPVFYKVKRPSSFP